jgi:hypothetical protein
MTVCLESFLPIGYLIKSAKVGTSLFWFGLRIFGFLQIFYSQAVIPRKIVESPAFLEYG